LQPLVELNADIPKQEMTPELTEAAVWSTPFKDGKCVFLSTSGYPTFTLAGTSKIEHLSLTSPHHHFIIDPPTAASYSLSALTIFVFKHLTLQINQVLFTFVNQGTQS
jgi:hypothetical protein